MFHFPIPELTLAAIVLAILLVAYRKEIIKFFQELGRPKPPSSQKPLVEGNSAIAAKKPDGEQTGPRNPADVLPDGPSADDYLDYKSYAETLAGLIAHKDTKTPLTVGLFGAWGSGKTTLMRMIERELQETDASKRFVIVQFDAWKYYKEDALWRALLLKVLNTLRPDPADKTQDGLRDRIQRLEESLYRDVEWEEKGGLTIDWPKLVKAGAGGALKLSFSFVPGLSTVLKAVEAAQESVGKGEVANDVYHITEAFQRHMVTHHQSQLLELEQFQIKFHELIKDYFTDRILTIFVDDLDRCLPEKAIEVLEAIKLFLDVEGCVFVLGIDQEIITRGLEAKYKQSGIATNGESQVFSARYIEKLIQLPFYLPPIEAHEMQSYIDRLNVAWPHANCPHVFAEGLSPNPRQIKRTINVFMLLWKLAKRRANLGDAVTPLRLAKVVILQTAHPTVFEHLKSDPPLLKVLENLSCEADSVAATAQSTNPFLAQAVQQTNLKKLFQLFVEDRAARFAELQLDELSAFFSLARRAPLVTENFARSPDAPARDAAEAIDRKMPPRQPRPPFQLRPPVRDFVGRQEVISRMLSALGSEFSTGVITGMAGTGKTELALLLGERLRAKCRDGQIFVDMQGNTETPLTTAVALSTCIRALTERSRELPSDVESLAAIYRTQLNEKHVLILLDNAANAAQVAPLTPPKGSLLLVTSRTALVLSKMEAIALNPLSADEALTLFTSIVSRVPQEIAAEICSLCGYLPPAVRAAASTLAATADLDPAEYQQKLGDEQKRLKLLGAQGMNITLEASFNLSYQRLSDETATVFRKLAVFPDTFDATAEEVICEDPNHSHLSALVRLSLVSYNEGERRYQVHPLMRLFAQRRLETIESESARKSHATYFLDILKTADERYNDGDNAWFEALSIFDSERSNISAGFDWTAAQAPSDHQVALLCVQYAKYGLQILEIRELATSRLKWFESALIAARQVGERKDQLPPLLGLGAAYSKLEKPQEAIEMYTEALKLSKEFKLLQQEALIQSNLGLKYRDLGHFDQAVERFAEQLKISQDLGDRKREGVALVNLANVSLRRAKIDEAIEYLEEAMAISHEIGDLQTEALVAGNLGRAYFRNGDAEQALVFCRRQLEISQFFGDRRSEATAHVNIGLALQLKGDLKEARAELSSALQIYRQFESTEASARVEGLLARIDVRLRAVAELDSSQDETVQ